MTPEQKLLAPLNEIAAKFCSEVDCSPNVEIIVLLKNGEIMRIPACFLLPAVTKLYSAG